MPDRLPPIGGSPTPVLRPMFRSLAIAARGLSAQRARMEVIAGNIANAETTHGESGAPYQRRVVELQSTPDTLTPQPPELPPLPPLPGDEPQTFSDFLATAAQGPRPDPVTVRVAGVATDTTEGPLVYEPGHPDANADGYVRYPNVRITDEIVDLMEARRVYEANATVFQSLKSMLRRSIDI